MSVKQMREKISSVYCNETWRNRVNNMPDRQVIAIYHKFMNEGRFKEPNKNFRQMTVSDYI